MAQYQAHVNFAFPSFFFSLSVKALFPFIFFFPPDAGSNEHPILLRLG